MAIPADSIPARGQGWQGRATDPMVARAARTLPAHRARVVFCYGALNHGASQSERSYQIALTTDDLRQLQNTFAAQWQRAPSPEEMHGLVEQKIREEILYRAGVDARLGQRRHYH